MKTHYEILMQDPEFRRELAIEQLATDASELISRLMEDQQLNKADLARRLNKSRAWVTHLMSGRANVTIRTLAEVVHALGAEVSLDAQPSGTATRPMNRHGEIAWQLGKPECFAVPQRVNEVFSAVSDDRLGTLREDSANGASEEAEVSEYAA